jgi:ankyrin repeat protein
MIGKLIKFGATFDQADNRGFTLLDKTVETNSMTNVALLIDYWGRVLPFEVLQKAKKYAQTLFMGDVLNELEKGGKPMVVDAHWSPSDIDKRTGLNDFHCAVINGDRVLLKKMLDKKADINKASQDEYGLRPLHYAVLHRHVRTAEFLLENKAQVDGTDLDGNTPLHMLAWLSDHVIAKELAQVLLKFNANPSIKNKEGNTLLHLLIYTNNRDLIEEIGKIVVLRTDIQNNDRETAKDLAQRLKRQDLLKNINKK